MRIEITNGSGTTKISVEKKDVIKFIDTHSCLINWDEVDEFLILDEAPSTTIGFGALQNI